jgi:preprotein translocase subunit SecD
LDRATIRSVDGRVEVRVYDADVSPYRTVIESTGKLELRELGSPEEHKIGYDSNWQKVPPGLLLRKNPEPRGTPPSVVAYGHVLLKDPPVVTGEHISLATANRVARPGQGISWEIAFKLNDAGAKRFLESTTRLSKSTPKGHIAIVLNDKVELAPVVESPIKDEGVVHGSFTEAEARALAAVLSSGTLPKPLKRISERVDPGK